MPQRKVRVLQQGSSNLKQASRSLFGKNSDLLSTNVQLLQPSQSVQTFFLKKSSSVSHFNYNNNSTSSIPQTNQSQLYEGTRKKLSNPIIKGHQKYHSSTMPNMIQEKKNDDKVNSFVPLQKEPYKPSEGKVKQIMEKIRQTYKHKSNIKKISKAWGFENKGYVTADNVKQIVEKHLGINATLEQINTLINKFSPKQNKTKQTKLDMLGFVRLAFNEQPFIKPSIGICQALQWKNQTNLKKSSSCNELSLLKKIQNLNQTTLYSKSKDELGGLQSSLPQINRQYINSAIFNKQDNEKNITSLTSSQLLNASQPSIYQALHNKTQSPKFSYSSVKSHGKLFNPLQFKQTNQQKTRFGATPPVHLNDQNLPQNKREKIYDEKIKIVETLQKQRIKEKNRYECKLDKIRKNRANQKENIELIENKNSFRIEANMKKMRQENLAYNYINFVHNEWK